jgi:hypothetical protein
MDELDLEPIDLAPPTDPTTRRTPIAPHRWPIGVLAATAVCGLLFVLYSGSHHRPLAIPTRTSQDHATTLAPGPIDPQLQLDVRVLLFAGREENNSCDRPPAFSQVTSLYSDSAGRHCYGLGNVVLTGTILDATSVAYDPVDREWAVRIHWAVDLPYVLQPFASKTLAVVWRGAVVSTVTIRPGFAGSILVLRNNYSREQAVSLAAAITGIAPSSVRVDAR